MLRRLELHVEQLLRQQVPVARFSFSRTLWAERRDHGAESRTLRAARMEAVDEETIDRVGGGRQGDARFQSDQSLVGRREGRVTMLPAPHGGGEEEHVIDERGPVP